MKPKKEKRFETSLLLKAQVVINLKYSTEETLQRLQEFTAKPKAADYFTLFKGKIDHRIHSFIIWPNRDYGSRNYFRPIVFGRIENGYCHLIFKPNLGIKLHLLAILILFFFVFPFVNNLGFSFLILAGVPILTINYLGAYFILDYKIEKSLKKLKDILGEADSNEIV